MLRQFPMLLNSQLPPEFWGAAVMLATDIYNVTPHESLNDESPFMRAKGQQALKEVHIGESKLAHHREHA